MSFKLNKLTMFMFLALAMLVASSQTARAETIFLKCGQMNVITVDLANHTVNNKTANITPVAIDWDDGNKYSDVHFHIDRAAGTLTTSGTYHTQSGDTPIPQGTPDTCTKSSAPSTKF